jgi:hypothetical protein
MRLLSVTLQSAGVANKTHASSNARIVGLVRYVRPIELLLANDAIGYNVSFTTLEVYVATTDVSCARFDEKKHDGVKLANKKLEDARLVLEAQCEWLLAKDACGTVTPNKVLEHVKDTLLANNAVGAMTGNRRFEQSIAML